MVTPIPDIPGEPSVNAANGTDIAIYLYPFGILLYSWFVEA